MKDKDGAATVKCGCAVFLYRRQMMADLLQIFPLPAFKKSQKNHRPHGSQVRKNSD